MFQFPTLSLESSEIRIYSNISNEGNPKGIRITCKDLRVDGNSRITGDNAGFPANQGPGTPGTSNPNYGTNGGAGHGGERLNKISEESRLRGSLLQLGNLILLWIC